MRHPCQANGEGQDPVGVGDESMGSTSARANEPKDNLVLAVVTLSAKRVCAETGVAERKTIGSVGT